MNPRTNVHILFILIVMLFVFSGLFLPPFLTQSFLFDVFFSQLILLGMPILLYWWLTPPSSLPILPFALPDFIDVLFIIFLTIPLVFVGSFLNAAIIFLLSIFAGPISQPIYLFDPGQPLVIYLIGMALLPAVLEEIISRGLLLGSYLKQGNRLAIWVSALLFSLLHLNLVNVPNTLMLGIFFAWLVLYTHSLLSAMLAHFVYNTVVLVLQTMPGLPPQTESISITLSELGLMVPSVVLYGLLFLGFFSLYKKKHPPVPLESRNQAFARFLQLLKTEKTLNLALLLPLVLTLYLTLV